MRMDVKMNYSCPFCGKNVRLDGLYVYDDDDIEYWHYECAIKERTAFEGSQCQKKK